MSTTSEEFRLIDLIYFDFDKAASLYSQIHGGLVEKIEEASKEGSTTGGKVRVGVLGIGAEAGTSLTEKESLLLTKRLHHDLLLKIETVLFDKKAAIDCSSLLGNTDGVESFHNKLKAYDFIRASGWCVIEDYNIVRARTSKFNEICQFLSEINLHSNSDFILAQEQLTKLKDLRNSTKEKGKKKEITRQIAELQIVVDQVNETIKKELGIPEFLKDGIVKMIDIYLKDRINIRMYPDESMTDLEIIGNLYKRCFVNTNLDNTFFSYSNRPDVKLTLFGLITSIPSVNGKLFDPYKDIEDEDSDINEGNGDSEEIDKGVLERGFRAAFKGLNNMEDFYIYNRYPKVTVYPIAVYREIRMAKQ